MQNRKRGARPSTALQRASRTCSCKPFRGRLHVPQAGAQAKDGGARNVGKRWRNTKLREKNGSATGMMMPSNQNSEKHGTTPKEALQGRQKGERRLLSEHC